MANNKFYENERLINTIHAKGAKVATKVKLGAKTNDNEKRLYVDIRKFVHKKGATRGFGQHTTSGIAFDVTGEEGLHELHELIKSLQSIERDLKGQKKDSTVEKLAK